MGLQEGVRINIEVLNRFHDYMIAFLILILSFVTYIFIYVSLSLYSDKVSMDRHFLESVWTVAPMFVLIFMAFPSMYLLYLLEEFSFPSVSVKVIGHQWYWEYQYSDLDSSYSFDSYILQDTNSFHNLDVDSRLVLPGHVDILFLVTSADVLHSWTVPTLGIKVDAIPGRLNYLSTCSLRSGVFYGQCSEICGANHRFIPIVVEFTSIEYFLSHISGLFN